MNYLHHGIRLAWLVVGLGMCAFVLYATMMPNPPSLKPVANFDKIEHGTGFLGMGLWFGALYRRKLLYVLAFLSAFGALTEVLQATLTTQRSGDPMDWLADTIGAILGLTIVRLMGVDWPYWLWSSARQNRLIPPAQARDDDWRLL